MITYLVGGAVRDKLLGREIRDNDYVICNSSHEEMLKAGFIQVGSDHSVYLHPETKEEYSLALDIYEDLARRDLTINAMALQDHELIDPFHGAEDLKQRVLRHVKALNFHKDPLRVYRLARFFAELPDFSIDLKTVKLIIDVATSRAFMKILPERILKELEKVLVSAKPSKFFLLLKENNLLKFHFQEIDNLSEKSFALTLGNIDELSENKDPGLSYASLFALTNPSDPIGMSKRLLVSNEWARYASIVQKFFQKFLSEISCSEIVESFYQMDAYRNPKHIDVLSKILSINGHMDKSLLIERAFKLTCKISAQNITQNVSGKELGLAIKQERIRQLESAV